MEAYIRWPFDNRYCNKPLKKGQVRLVLDRLREAGIAATHYVSPVELFDGITYEPTGFVHQEDVFVVNGSQKKRARSVIAAVLGGRTDTERR